MCRSLLLVSLVQPPEVVAWADGWLTRLDESPEALVEVSLNGSRPDELLSAPSALAEYPLSPGTMSVLCRLSLEYLARSNVQHGSPDGVWSALRMLESLRADGWLPDAHPLEGQSLEVAALAGMFSLTGDPLSGFTLEAVRQDVPAFLHRHAGQLLLAQPTPDGLDSPQSR